MFAINFFSKFSLMNVDLFVFKLVFKKNVAIIVNTG